MGKAPQLTLYRILTRHPYTAHLHYPLTRWLPVAPARPGPRADCGSRLIGALCALGSSEPALPGGTGGSVRHHLEGDGVLIYMPRSEHV